MTTPTRTGARGNPYASKPWEQLYRPDESALPPLNEDLLTAFRRVVRETPDDPAIVYFDCSYSYGWLDVRSSAFAAWLEEQARVSRGDRVAVVLQNVPDFVVVSLAAWKVGAVPMPLNPMYKMRELGHLFADAEPRVVVCHAGSGTMMCDAIAAAGLPEGTPVVTVRPQAHQRRNDTRVMPAEIPTDAGCIDISGVLRGIEGAHLPCHTPALGDMALLLYTSGTTGLPKGAQLSHENLIINARLASHVLGLRARGRIFALAPLFHITGFDLHVCTAIVTGSAVILAYRFEPNVVLDALLEHQPTFTVGAITAYIALLGTAGASARHFASLDRMVSGGAPIPPMVIERFQQRFGRSIRSGYGMTEIAGASHLSITDSIPVHTETGALAVGLPVPGLEVEIRTEDDQPAPVGDPGEIVMRGPIVMNGYWRNPEATAEAICDGWLRSGDVGIMDASGWFYIVDRKKDMISASGFKVWPREIEDVIYQFPGVREVAVVGAPDGYRGETVVAYVSFSPGKSVRTEDLIGYCREHLANFKVPRRIDILPDLPKTATGKIMRAELRRQLREAAAPRVDAERPSPTVPISPIAPGEP
jgi:long-chain acyl-CoA synthetase